MHPLLFYLGLALLLTHELDAVRLREWRMLPWLSRLPDKRARPVFILGHAPLLFGLLWLVMATGESTGPHPLVAIGIDLFLLLHLVLHLIFLRHPRNEFRSAASWSLIAGGAAAGGADAWFLLA